jgi:hypothetical protein
LGGSSDNDDFVFEVHFLFAISVVEKYSCEATHV